MNDKIQRLRRSLSLLRGFGEESSAVDCRSFFLSDEHLLRKVSFLLLLLVLLPFSLRGNDSIESMLYALEMAAYLDKKLNEPFPVTFNHTLSTGYFTTPSARMTDAGEIGFGVAYAPPYLNLNARIQPFRYLELSANYRNFLGVEDQGLSPHGFGNYADRGANVKIALMTPEDSYYGLPGIAFGVEDFMGSKKFLNYFVVGTYVFPGFGVEASLGWGAGRYTHGPSRGFFGGMNWFPFHAAENKWIKGVCLSAEFDPVDYTNPEREPNPHGRVTNTPINFGVKYQFCNILELSAAFIRGAAFAFAGSFNYNWGRCKGLLPKLSDPEPYSGPLNSEPVGCTRPESVMIQQIYYALEEQGILLRDGWFENRFDREGYETTWLVLKVLNSRYLHEEAFRMRVQYLLAAITPSNIENICVIVESYGLPCQQYVYTRELLVRYANHCMSPYEFDILTPREEYIPPDRCKSRLLFHKRYDLWKAKISPRVENFFGSAAGKYKYDMGLKLNVEGFLPWNWFYETQLSYTLFSNIDDIGDYDIYNPSQLPIVATDYIRYRQEGIFSIDRLYTQKSWNLGRGYFARFACGYFQVNYGGAALEALWYPVCQNLAIGVEGAVVKKRTYNGLGFQTKLKQLQGYTPTYHHYTVLTQYFLNLYLDFPAFSFFAKLGVGQFLARDKGVKLEVTRYFENGIRLSGWITYTDACDKVNGVNYYDRGVAIEVPFDLFYQCSSRRVWNYAMGAWLRDAGYATTTGRPLFEMINRERRW